MVLIALPFFLSESAVFLIREYQNDSLTTRFALNLMGGSALAGILFAVLFWHLISLPTIKRRGLRKRGP